MSKRVDIPASVIGLAGAIVLALAADLPSQEKRATPPTTWDQRVRGAFFDDARSVLNGSRPDYGTRRQPGGQVAGTGSAPGDASAATPAGGFAWSTLVSAETLQDEVKAYQPQLSADVRSQQVFLGGAFQNSRRSFTVLAAAFAVINEFDKDVRWKNQAPAARDLFARAGFNCKTATTQSFNEAKLRTGDLIALLQGETVSPPSGVEPKNQWDKVVDRSPLMNRLELAQQERIAPWTANTTEFKKNSAALRHEAQMVALIAEILTREGLDDAGDETYDGYSKAMQQAALQIVEAVNSENADAARTAAGALQQSCSACHADYRS